MEIKDRIKSARKGAGFSSQEAFAYHLGVAKRTVERWENGVGPSVKQLPQIAQATGKSVGYLLGEDDSEEATASLIDSLIAALQATKTARSGAAA